MRPFFSVKSKDGGPTALQCHGIGAVIGNSLLIVMQACVQQIQSSVLSPSAAEENVVFHPFSEHMKKTVMLRRGCFNRMTCSKVKLRLTSVTRYQILLLF
jgi:hypothetical protein